MKSKKFNPSHLLAAPMCLAMVISLVACGNTNSDFNNNSSTGDNASTTQEAAQSSDNAENSNVGGIDNTYTLFIEDCHSEAFVGEVFLDAVSYGYKNLEGGYFSGTDTLDLDSDGSYTLSKKVETGTDTVGVLAYFEYVFTGTYTADGSNITLSAATAASVEEDFGGFVVALANGVPHTGDADKFTGEDGTVTGGTGTSDDYPELLEYFNSEYLTKGGNSEQVVTISDDLLQFVYGADAEIVGAGSDSSDENENTSNEGTAEENSVATLSGVCAGNEMFSVSCVLNEDGTVTLIRGISNNGEWAMSSEWDGTWEEAENGYTITINQTEDEIAAGAAATSVYTAEDDGTGNYAFRWYKSGLTEDGSPAGSEEDQAYYSNLTTAK